MQLVVHCDETNCMWSTGNFIKGDFPLALVIALRINIFLASRMDGLQGSFFVELKKKKKKRPELTSQPVFARRYPRWQKSCVHA